MKYNPYETNLISVDFETVVTKDIATINGRVIAISPIIYRLIKFSVLWKISFIIIA
jgi:hypothetical protein